MRTVWIAFLCLIGLAITAVAKIGMSPYASAEVSRGVPFAKTEVSEGTLQPSTVVLSSENVTAETKLQNDPTSTKADKLEILYPTEAAPEVKLVKSVAIRLPTTELKQPSEKMERVVSRHWHDPLDKRNVPAAAQRHAKRKLSIVIARAPKS
jgi:hypothetical protein